jgi:hypothetical protein
MNFFNGMARRTEEQSEILGRLFGHIGDRPFGCLRGKLLKSRTYLVTNPENVGEWWLHHHVARDP